MPATGRAVAAAPADAAPEAWPVPPAGPCRELSETAARRTPALAGCAAATSSALAAAVAVGASAAAATVGAEAVRGCRTAMPSAPLDCMRLAEAIGAEATSDAICPVDAVRSEAAPLGVRDASRRRGRGAP